MCFFVSELLISKVWHRSHSLIHRSFFYFYYHRKYCTIYASCGIEGSRQIIIKVGFFFNYEVCFLFRIVLDAGYFLHTRAFFDNVGTILLYAVVVSKHHFPCLEDFLKETVHSQKRTRLVALLSSSQYQDVFASLAPACCGASCQQACCKLIVKVFYPQA